MSVQAGRRGSAAAARRRVASSPPAQTGPVTISTGGTYTLNVLASNSTTQPQAVTVTTTAPVTIINSVIQHAGVGIWAQTTGTQLTVKNSTFTALTPTVANIEQQHINARENASLIVENNQFNFGHGVQVSTGGGGYTTSPLSISYNNYINIGKLSQPAIYQGAVHLDTVTAPNGRIVWNRVTNSYGSTHGEDMIAAANSRGTAGNRLEVAHNLVNGTYPFTGNGASFTGGAIDLGDISGGYIYCHHCYVTNYTNNGFMQPTNSPAVNYDNCMAVYDGIADDGTTTVSSTFGYGIQVNNLYDATGSQARVSNCRIGHRRWNGTAWETTNYYWENQTAQDDGGNTTLTPNLTNKQALLAEFEASVTNAGVTIGTYSGAAPAPLAADVFDTDWSSTADPKTVTIPNCVSGDQLFLIGGSGHIGGSDVTAVTVSTTAGTTGSWTKPQENLNVPQAEAWITSATAQVTASGNVTVQVDPAKTASTSWGFVLVRARNSTGLGSSGYVDVSATQQVSLTTVAGAAVLVASIDWDAGTVGTSWAPTDAGQIERQMIGGNFTVHAAYWVGQTAGTRSYGSVGAGGASRKTIGLVINP